MTPFGIKLRQYRKDKGLTLAVMARNLGVTSAYLSQLENGRRGEPSPVLVDQICALFGLIWDDAEELKSLARLSRIKVMIDTSHLGVEATRTANLMAQLLPRVDEEDAAMMASWLEDRLKSL